MGGAGTTRLIPLAQYALEHGRSDISARQMAQRGGFRTARKIGRNWVIDRAEPYPDRRRRQSDIFDAAARDELDPDERRGMLKRENARRAAECGKYHDTFDASWRRLTPGLVESCTPEQLGQIVDLLRAAYHDGVESKR